MDVNTLGAVTWTATPSGFCSNLVQRESFRRGHRPYMYFRSFSVQVNKWRLEGPICLVFFCSRNNTVLVCVSKMVQDRVIDIMKIHNNFFGCL